MELAKVQEPSQRLAPSLQKTEPEALLAWVLHLALRRGCSSLSPEELELRRDDLLNPRSYAAQLAGRDVAIEPEDFEDALYTLGTAPRGEYEQIWPSLDVMIAAVLTAHMRRTADERHEAGKDFMERHLQAAQRDREEQNRIWRERKLEREAKAAAEQAESEKPTQAPQTSTPPPAAPSVSVVDMQPDECDVFVTFLETMSYESLVTAMRAVGTIHCADDQAAVARALRALWLSKGKDARNLLVLVKGEKSA